MDGETAVLPSVAGVTGFSYEEAFGRNLGWFTIAEQQSLRGKCVAIAGMGGVGGGYLLTLARMGLGAFRIADPDSFELVNFNRQAGATLGAIGRPKVAVMAERALDINPELRIARFDNGVDENNVDDFLVGADLYIDAIDFFVIDIRRKLMARCAELGIPAVLAAPLGMGAAYLLFRPGGMSFEDWFRFEGLSAEQQYVNFLLGLAPSGLHRPYLVDPSHVDLRGKRGPSTAAACELCAGVAAIEAVKLLLGRGPVRAVPYYHHFDAYRGRLVIRKLRGGNRHPLQRLKIAVMRRLAAKWSAGATPAAAASNAAAAAESR
jgi:molybdopterin/thiamine biosynthesis adenylyltransferase